MNHDASETVVYFGDEVKSLGDGKIGGYVVVFGDASQTDLSAMKDFFTSACDFGLDLGNKGRVIFNHGCDPALKRLTLGVAEMKVDAKGVWAEAQIQARDDYTDKVKRIIGKDIPELIAAKKLGWSTGTASHLVERTQMGAAHRIDSWPLGLDVSLTPTPAEPRTLAVPLKSLMAADTKGVHLAPHVPVSAAMAAMDRLHDGLKSAVLGHMMGWKDAPDGSKPDRAGREACIKGCLDEHAAHALKCCKALMDDAADDGDDDSVKSLILASVKAQHAGLRLAEHSEMVRVAVEGLLSRAEALAAKRATDGRRISPDRLTEMQALAGRLGAFVKASEPRPSEADILELRRQILRDEAELDSLSLSFIS